MPSKLRKVSLEDPLDAEKPLIVPLVTVISSAAKLLVTSLAVNVSDRVASPDVNPSIPSAAVMVMVGPVVS